MIAFLFHPCQHPFFFLYSILTEKSFVSAALIYPMSQPRPVPDWLSQRDFTEKFRFFYFSSHCSVSFMWCRSFTKPQFSWSAQEVSGSCDSCPQMEFTTLPCMVYIGILCKFIPLAPSLWMQLDFSLKALLLLLLLVFCCCCFW